MKLLTLNLRHGGGARVPAIAEWLARQSPDIAVLTEYRANAAGKRLYAMLAAAGTLQRTDPLRAAAAGLPGPDRTAAPAHAAAVGRRVAGPGRA